MPAGIELAKAYILIRAPIRHLNADLIEARKTITKNLAGAAEISKWQFMGIGIFLEKLFRGMEKWVDAGARQLEAELRLQAVMKATGEAAGFSAEQLMEYANELQDLTMIEDVRVMEAMAKLATFKNIQGETYKRALKAATDIERMGFANLNRASIQLGRALQDPLQGMEAMTRFGISLGKETRELIKDLAKQNRLHEAQEVILRAVEGKMKDVAVMVGTTQMGAYRVLMAKITDYKELLGRDLIPLEIEMRTQQLHLLKVWRPLTMLIGSVAEATGQWIPNIRLLNSLLVKLAVGVTAVGFAMKQFSIPLTLTTFKFGTLITGGVFALVAALAALSAAITGIWRYMTRTDRAQKQLAESGKRLSETWRLLWESATPPNDVAKRLGGESMARFIKNVEWGLRMDMAILKVWAESTKIVVANTIGFVWNALATGKSRTYMRAMTAGMTADFEALQRHIGKMVTDLPELARIPAPGERGFAVREGALIGFAEHGRKLQESLLRRTSPEQETADNTEMIHDELKTQTDIMRRAGGFAMGGGLE